MPDSRKVYAELQRELHEIDTLLEGDGKDADVARSSRSWRPSQSRKAPVGSFFKEGRLRQ
jgi:hypothetical protein